MRAGWSANVTTGAHGVQPGRSAKRRAAARLIKCAASSALHPASQRCLLLPRACPGCALRRALSPCQIMFSFFKRFKGSKESDDAPEEPQTAPECLGAQSARRAGGARGRSSQPAPAAAGTSRRPQLRAEPTEPKNPRSKTDEIVPPPARSQREALVALAAEDRTVENEFEPDRNFRRRENRRGSVRRTRNRAADVGCGRRSHRIPARSAARKSARRTPDRCAAGQDRAAHTADRLAQAARKIADAWPRATAGDDDRGRERRGQDHQHRQAREASAELRAVGAARRRRHVPRRRARTTRDLGRTQQRDGGVAGKRRPGRRDLRRGGRRARAQDRRDDGRHGWPSADAIASDGRAAQGEARDRQGAWTAHRTKCCS